MTLVLPNPGVPANGQVLDATPLLQNQTAIVNAIQSFDGSQIQNGTVPAAAMAAGVNPNTLLYETSGPFVASGCIWSISSGLIGAMTPGVAYVANTSSQLLLRVNVATIAANTFAASQDTYIDVDYNGNVTYHPVNNNAAAPSITANAMRLAIVVTNGSAITNIYQPPNQAYGLPVEAYVNTLETRASSTYGDLATVGPTVVMRVGPKGKMKVEADLYMQCSAADFIGVSINSSYGIVIGAADQQGQFFKGTNDIHAAYVRTYDSLASDIAVVKLQYKANSGTGSFSNRALTITGY